MNDSEFNESFGREVRCAFDHFRVRKDVEDYGFYFNISIIEYKVTHNGELVLLTKTPIRVIQTKIWWTTEVAQSFSSGFLTFLGRNEDRWSAKKRNQTNAIALIREYARGGR